MGWVVRKAYPRLPVQAGRTACSSLLLRQKGKASTRRGGSLRQLLRTTRRYSTAERRPRQRVVFAAARFKLVLDHLNCCVVCDNTLYRDGLMMYTYSTTLLLLVILLQQEQLMPVYCTHVVFYAKLAASALDLHSDTLVLQYRCDAAAVAARMICIPGQCINSQLYALYLNSHQTCCTYYI